MDIVTRNISAIKNKTPAVGKGMSSDRAIANSRISRISRSGISSEQTNQQDAVKISHGHDAEEINDLQ